MRHCSSCKHCIMDVTALKCGVVIDKCAVKKHNILHPFFSGFRCKGYRKYGE